MQILIMACPETQIFERCHRFYFGLLFCYLGPPLPKAESRSGYFYPKQKKEEGEKKIRATKKIPKSIGSRFRNAYGIIKEKKEGRNKKEKYRLHTYLYVYPFSFDLLTSSRSGVTRSRKSAVVYNVGVNICLFSL